MRTEHYGIIEYILIVSQGPDRNASRSLLHKWLQTIIFVLPIIYLLETELWMLFTC